MGEDAGGEAMDVDEFSIVASLMCACLHVILELSNLYLESKTSQSSFRDYMVACYNARQGWLPQEGDFFKINDDDESEKQNTEINVLSKEIMQLESHNSDDEFGGNKSNLFDLDIKSKNREQLIEFDNKDEEYLCCGYSVTFEFSDNSITYLFNIIANMRHIDQKFQHRKKVLMLGACIQNVSITNIIQLLRLAHAKIDVVFDEAILI